MILSKRLLRIAVVTLTAATMLLPSGVSASHDGTCHPDDPPPGGSGGHIRFSANIHTFGLWGSLGASFTADGAAREHGVLHVRGHRGQVFLLVDGSTRATCADADGDGIAGLTQLELGLRAVRTREPLSVVITPADGDMDQSGKYVVKVLAGRTKFEGVAQVVFVER